MGKQITRISIFAFLSVIAARVLVMLGLGFLVLRLQMELRPNEN